MKKFDIVFYSSGNFIEEKLQKNWITSGKLGSRDAVLVFRTNILNPKNRKSILDLADHSKLDNEENEDNEDNEGIEIDPSNSNHKVPIKSLSKNSKNVSVDKSSSYRVNSKLELRNSIPNSQNGSSLSETSVTSNENKPINYNEETNSQQENNNNSSIEVNLNKEVNTSEEEQDPSSEEDIECGKIMPAHHLNVTYKFIQTETKLLRKIFNVHGLTEVHGDSDFCLLWSGVHMKLDILRNLALYQRVNHFPRYV